MNELDLLELIRLSDLLMVDSRFEIVVNVFDIDGTLIDIVHPKDLGELM